MIYHKIMLKFVTITLIWRNILIVINSFKVFLSQDNKTVYKSFLKHKSAL